MVYDSSGSNKVKETAEQKALAEIAKEKWDRYEQVFQPVEDEFIERVQSIDEGDRDHAAGMASAGATQAFTQAGRGLRREQFEAGAAPGSGRVQAATGGLRRDMAQSRAAGGSDARRNTTNRRLAGQQAAAKLGAGLDVEAISTIADVARTTQQDSIMDARMSAQNRATNAQAYGSAAGLGLSYARNRDRGGGGGSGLHDSGSPPDDGYRGGL